MAVVESVDQQFPVHTRRIVSDRRLGAILVGASSTPRSEVMTKSPSCSRVITPMPDSSERRSERKSPASKVRVCRWAYSGLTFSAQGPFGPCASVNDTRWPSWSCSNATPLHLEEWKNKSFAVPVLIKPKPLSVSFLIVPSAMTLPKKGLRGNAGPKLLGPCRPHTASLEPKRWDHNA